MGRAETGDRSKTVRTFRRRGHVRERCAPSLHDLGGVVPALRAMVLVVEDIVGDTGRRRVILGFWKPGWVESSSSCCSYGSYAPLDRGISPIRLFCAPFQVL